MYEYEYPHPAVTTDIVVFSLRGQDPAVLLIRRGAEPFKGCWALPGGFVGENEDLDACARRELAEETGLTGVVLEQLHAFSRPDRDPRERVISIAYCGVITEQGAAVQSGSDADAAAWFGLEQLPELAFDHGEIVATARARLATELA